MNTRFFYRTKNSPSHTHGIKVVPACGYEFPRAIAESNPILAYVGANWLSSMKNKKSVIAGLKERRAAAAYYASKPRQLAGGRLILDDE